MSIFNTKYNNHSYSNIILYSFRYLIFCSFTKFFDESVILTSLVFNENKMNVQ